MPTSSDSRRANDQRIIVLRRDVSAFLSCRRGLRRRCGALPSRTSCATRPDSIGSSQVPRPERSSRSERPSFCPGVADLSGGKDLGILCADAISEARIIQIARARPPDDLIGLRRLVMQLRPALGWLEVAHFGLVLGTKPSANSSKTTTSPFTSSIKEPMHDRQELRQLPCPDLAQPLVPESRRHEHAEDRRLRRPYPRAHFQSVTQARDAHQRLLPGPSG